MPKFLRVSDVHFIPVDAIQGIRFHCNNERNVTPENAKMYLDVEGYDVEVIVEGDYIETVWDWLSERIANDM